ncbi:MAG: SH3 domain-containing protein [Lachnospiraceae bacterium]|uniref:C40 family peptidase n=1 Tax=Roseburia hominis TaxID=301301 RepID=UPI0026EA6158|nr:C40 family peptidase [Roseburia hominis]MCI5876806.1 SH3 domain-containing protein [Lachnospiraceae bacterium]MCI7523866.1 SH3 domain-containing protein [Roseburia hominis]
MKKRMTILALLLAGTVTLGSYGMVQAGQEKREVPVAGVTQTLAQVLKEAGGVQAQTADAVEELQSNAAVARMMEPEMVEEEAWETAEVAEHELPQTASEFADIAVAQVNHYVNVRQEPDTESEILGKLYDKSAATVLETTEDGWYRITSGNVNGYVKAEYVVVGDEELAKSVGTRLATVTTTTLFVRTEPTTEAKVLTMLPDGDDVVVTDETTEGWAKVSTADGDGYVALDYVTLSTEYIHAESKAEEEARLAREEAERQEAARAAEEARKAREAEAARAAAEQEAARKAAEKQEAKKAGSGSSAATGSSTGSSAGSGSGSSAGQSAQTASSNGQAVVDYARQFLGNPYVYGGNSLTNGTDCSGFVKGVYAAFGINLPRTSAEQRSVGYAVSLSEIQPGDIVCYSGHVGIYAGNNTLIHASNEKTGITLTSPVTYRSVLAVRRIF